MRKAQRPGKKNFTLYDGKGDISKRWHIFYYVGKKRVQVYGDINRGATYEEKFARSQLLLRELKKEFKQLPANIDQRAVLYKALEFDRAQLRKKSFQTYKSKLDVLFEWLDGNKLTTDNLRRFFDQYRRSHSQTGTYDCRRMLMTYFKKTGNEHLLKPIRIKKGTHQPLRYFQPHQCTEILDHLEMHDPQLHLHCLFIYYTAIRPRSELINIRVGDIFFDEKKIAVRGEFAKNWKSEYIGIPERFVPHVKPLKTLPPMSYIFHAKRCINRPIGRNTLGERFQTVLNGLGYGSDYQLYSWKHTGAVAVYKVTKNIYALKKHLRHKEIQTTELYIRQLGLSDFADFYTKFPAPGEW